MSNPSVKTLLTQTQTDILFGEALANPDEQQFPLGEDEIVEAVQRFLKERDELVDELECRKSHADTEYGELKEQIKELDETIAYGRERLKGVIGRLTDATELLNTLGYIFDEDTETWEEKEKIKEEFLKRHNITEEEFLKCVDESCDYNLPKKKEEERRVQGSYDDEDSEPVGAWRIYCGCDAWKCDLPCEEEFFETLTEARARIDEINKENKSQIKLSYDTIDYEWYSESWVKKEEDTDEE